MYNSPLRIRAQRSTQSHERLKGARESHSVKEWEALTPGFWDITAALGMCLGTHTERDALT